VIVNIAIIHYVLGEKDSTLSLKVTYFGKRRRILIVCSNPKENMMVMKWMWDVKNVCLS